MRNLKKALALVLAMAMSLSLAVTAGAAYKDGDKISDEYAVAVEVASQLGILEGFEDGTYGPQKTLTRAQLATMTYRLSTADVEDAHTADFAGGAAAAFTDTPATAWYAGYVGYAADAGFLKGCGDNLYKPNSALTGYQALAAFLRVIGYNQPGQFTGADWTVQVAQIATQNGLLKGIEGVDLQAPISREVAAQIIYNALFAKNVSYTPAFGYQLSAKKVSLAHDLFGINSPKGGESDNIAPWGRPVTEWNTAGDKAVVTIAEAPIATYNVAVSDCQIAKDLGLKANDNAFEYYSNGGETTTAINILSQTKDNGAQGAVLEVYEDCIVEITTWLAMVTDVKAATYDANGHQATAAKTTFEVYDKTNVKHTWTAETADFTKGDYVLLNNSWWPTTTGIEGVQNPTVTTPVATAKVNEYNDAAQTTTIGGNAYTWAQKFDLGFKGTVGTTYNVYTDSFGNVIGLVQPAPAAPVYTILDCGVQITTDFNPHFEGKILDLATGKLNTVTVVEYNDAVFNWNDKQVAYEHNIVSVEVDDNGAYILDDAANIVGTNGQVIKGTPRIYADGAQVAVSDANTVYAVETACGTYEMYTGFEAVPSIEYAAKIEVLLGDNNYADLVYIDATNAVYANSETFVYVMEGASKIAEGVLDNGVAYDIYDGVVINGVATTLKVADGFTMPTQCSVEMVADSNGLVYKYNHVAFGEYTVAEANSGDVVYLNNGSTNGYLVASDSMIWIVDQADKEAKVGTAEDFVKDCTVYAVLNKDGKTIDKAVIFAAID